MRKRELLAMIQSLEAVVDELTARLDAHESWATKFDATSDTVRIPADRIAESNAESSFIGGLDRTHERGTGYPIVQEFVIGGTITGPSPVMIESGNVIYPSSSFKNPTAAAKLTMSISAIDNESIANAFTKASVSETERSKIVVGVERSLASLTIEPIAHGVGYPVFDASSDESKRIAEAVANTPHSC